MASLTAPVSASHWIIVPCSPTHILTVYLGTNLTRRVILGFDDLLSGSFGAFRLLPHHQHLGFCLSQPVTLPITSQFSIGLNSDLNKNRVPSCRTHTSLSPCLPSISVQAVCRPVCPPLHPAIHQRKQLSPKITQGEVMGIPSPRRPGKDASPPI